MGRSRKDGDPFGLAGTRLAWKHGAFYYRHRDGRWERIGADVTVAKERAALYNDPTGVYGTVGYWLDMFLVDCAARVKAGTLAARTLSDYTKNVVELKPYFGSSLAEHLEPQHIQFFLDKGLEAGRPVRANRDIACLSSCLSWMMRNGNTTLKVNPCMQKSGTKGNSESKRERYVTDEEYLAAYAESGTQVRLLMELTYRTLQRPESDIIHWQSTVFTRDPHTGQRVLAFEQGKTKVKIKIAMTQRLELLAAQAIGTIPKLHQPVLHTRKGEPYTYTGIMSMLTSAIKRANKKRSDAGKAPIPAFGFRDLKGKGATDMWLSGIPIEQIQLLCGHADKATTEKYIKARWNATAQPNEVIMKGAF